MTKKNYYKLFADYCRKNGIWFSVLSSGRIEIMLDENANFAFGRELKFGTKAAYGWLVKEHKRLKGDD